MHHKRNGKTFTSLQWRRRQRGKLKALSPANSFWLLLPLVCLEKNKTIMDNFQLPPTPAFQRLRAVIAVWLLFNWENFSWTHFNECLNWSAVEELTAVGLILCFERNVYLLKLWAVSAYSQPSWLRAADGWRIDKQRLPAMDKSDCFAKLLALRLVQGATLKIFSCWECWLLSQKKHGSRLGFIVRLLLLIIAAHAHCTPTALLTKKNVFTDRIDVFPMYVFLDPTVDRY